MNEVRLKRLLSLQKMEATEAEVYRRLAKIQRDPVNKAILEGIALEEERHESVISKITKQKVRANRFQVIKHLSLIHI